MEDKIKMLKKEELEEVTGGAGGNADEDEIRGKLSPGPVYEAEKVEPGKYEDEGYWNPHR